MNASILLLSLLAGGAAPAPPPADSAEAAPVRVARGDAYEELSADYDAAYDAWREAKRAAADLAERRALRDAHPAKDFYPEFAGLAEAGEGRALLWMLRHVKDAGFERDEVEPVVAGLCRRLAHEHVGAAWFADDGLDALFAQRRSLGEEELERMLAGLLGRPDLRPEVSQGVLHRLGQMLAMRDDPEQRERGLAYYRRLVSAHPGSPLAGVARGEVFRLTRLQVGMVAPDFEAATHDGRAFRLSDFRGKVVVLDFWGFW